MSSSIFTVPYVCLYNGTGGMCSYSARLFPRVRVLSPDLGAPSPPPTPHARSAGLGFSFHISVIGAIERALPRSWVTRECCSFHKRVLIVFGENKCCDRKCHPRDASIIKMRRVYSFALHWSSVGESSCSILTNV